MKEFDRMAERNNLPPQTSKNDGLTMHTINEANIEYGEYLTRMSTTGKEDDACLHSHNGQGHSNPPNIHSFSRRMTPPDNYGAAASNGEHAGNAQSGTDHNDRAQQEYVRQNPPNLTILFSVLASR